MGNIKKDQLLLPLFVCTSFVAAVLIALTFNTYYLSPSLLLKILAGFIAIYLIFTFFYHHKEGTLLWEIVIEYILIASLALVILQSQLF